jgi:hypothetical protein
MGKAIVLIKQQKPDTPFDEWDRLILTCRIRYPNFLRDLDCELICDVLEKARIIPNDRQIREKHYFADDEGIDNPHLEIWLEAKGDVAWKKRPTK